MVIEIQGEGVLVSHSLQCIHIRHLYSEFEEYILQHHHPTAVIRGHRVRKFIQLGEPENFLKLLFEEILFLGGQARTEGSSAVGDE